jgi:hypothetical protein
MKIDSSLINYILSKYNQPSQPLEQGHFISEQLNKYQDTISNIASIEQKIIAEGKRHLEIMDKIEGERKLIQKACDHPIINTYSAQYDKYQECVICKKNL